MLYPPWIKYLCKFRKIVISLICKNTMIDIYVEKGKYFIYSKFHDRSFFSKNNFKKYDLRGFLERGTKYEIRWFGLNDVWDLRMGKSDREGGGGGMKRRKEGGPLWKDRLSFAKAFKRLLEGGQIKVLMRHLWLVYITSKLSTSNFRIIYAR